MKRVGPELKMPDLKVPAVLSDLLFDLRQRGLLPIVILVVVAIGAVPVLLGKGSEEKAAPPPPAVAIASGGSSHSLSVVQLKPGLREYSKRLSHRKPTDPFKQRFTAPVLKGAHLNSTTTSEGGEGGEGGGSTSAPSTGSPAKPGEIFFFATAIDVQITRTATKKDGGKEESGPTVRKRVLPYTVLPGEKNQVVTYMGVNPKTHQPLFLASDAVTAEFGEWKCISGTETCQLLEVEEGFPEVFAVGSGSTRYKLNVVNVEEVVTGHTQASGKLAQHFSK